MKAKFSRNCWPKTGVQRDKLEGAQEKQEKGTIRCGVIRQQFLANSLRGKFSQLPRINGGVGAVGALEPKQTREQEREREREGTLPYLPVQSNISISFESICCMNIVYQATLKQYTFDRN
jgi:hypothetical protein